MKRLMALLVGALVATGLTGTTAPSAAADTTITGDDWSMTLRIPNTSWSELFTTNFLVCQDLRIELTVAAPAGRAWSLAGNIYGVGSTVSLEQFTIAEDEPPTNPVPIRGVSMCEHFNGSVTPPNHEYVATGTATASDSATPPLPFEVRFTIDPMQCVVQARSHELRNGVSAFSGEVVEYARDGFKRPAPGGTVTIEQLDGSTWLKAAETTSAADGSFVLLAGSVLVTGSYVRFNYTGDYWCAGIAPYPVQVWPPYVPIPMPAPIVTPGVPAPVALPVPTVKIKAVSGRSKLKVDVNPNRGSKFYVFQVQRKNSDGSWKAVKSYETRGPKETRTLNLRKGTYRVWVRPGYGFGEAMSPNAVTLKR